MHQKYLPLSITTNGILICILCILIGIPGALYFANDGTDLVTLNFTNWTGHDFSGENPSTVATVFSYICRLLPPLYLITSLPLKALSMSLNLI